MAVQRNNFRRLLRTVEALSDLGPQLTTEREFSQTAQVMLSTLIEASGGREGALFLFSDKPSLLTSIASQGFTMLPDPAVIPLLPKHVHALNQTRKLRQHTRRKFHRNILRGTRHPIYHRATERRQPQPQKHAQLL